MCRVDMKTLPHRRSEIKVSLNALHKQMFHTNIPRIYKVLFSSTVSVMQTLSFFVYFETGRLSVEVKNSACPLLHSSLGFFYLNGTVLFKNVYQVLAMTLVDLCIIQSVSSLLYISFNVNLCCSMYHSVCILIALCIIECVS